MPMSVRRSGFSLTELAIVMGIMGGMLGAIWSAAGYVHQNYNDQLLARDIEFILTRLSERPVATSNFPGVAACHSAGSVYWGQTNTLTSATNTMLAKLGYIPNDMFTPSNPSVLNTAYSNQAGISLQTSGTCTTGTGNATADNNFVSLYTGNIPSLTCIKLLNEYKEEWIRRGLIQLCMNGCSVNYWYGTVPTNGWAGTSANAEAQLTPAVIESSCNTTNPINLNPIFIWPLNP